MCKCGCEYNKKKKSLKVFLKLKKDKQQNYWK